MVKRLCANGDIVMYEPLPGADHNGSMQKGAQAAHEWMAARFAGRKTKGNCRALPSAANG